MHLVLKASLKVPKYIKSGTPVVIHCSHGWDRTAQMSAIAQLLLDPHYRTLRGFDNLLKKNACGPN